MTNTVFRTAIGGFNRQDVTEYIEKTQRQAAESAAALEKQAADLRGALEAAQAELEEARAALADREKALEEQNQHLEALTTQCTTVRHNWDAQTMANAALREDVGRRDAALKELGGEKEGLARRVEALEAQLEAVRRDKERVAQLELDAHRRADEIISQANTQADDTVAQAEARAADTIAQADAYAANTAAQAEKQARITVTQAEAQAAATVSEANARAKALEERARAHSEDLLQQAEERITATAGQYSELHRSFETITGHITSELRKLDVAAGQLPISFNHLKEGLDELAERAKER